MKEELSFYDFTLLTKDQQYDLVFRKGEFIDSSSKNDVKFVLYKLCNFFVEISYYAENNKVVNLISFLNPQDQ